MGAAETKSIADEIAVTQEELQHLIRMGTCWAEHWLSDAPDGITDNLLESVRDALQRAIAAA